MKTYLTFGAACALAGAAGSGLAAESSADIKGYLVDIGAGHVAANEIIGLAGSAVSNLQTPKDLVAAVSGLGDPSSKAGFGIAFSPGRSGFRPMGVPVRDYASEANRMARLWGSTTFSYAQNKKTLQDVEYAQHALAVHVSYYLNAEEDPIVAGHRAAIGGPGSPCAAAAEAVDATIQAVREGVNAKASRLRAGRAGAILSEADLAAIDEQALREAKGEELADTLPDRIADAKAKRAGTRAAGDKARLTQDLDDLTTCARGVSAAAKAKWNASHLNLVLGQGWIKGPAAGDTRLSLGRHVAVALALSTREMPNSLFNLTLRRISRELDLDTIATASPSYKSSHVAAARYTYGYGAGRDTYVLAEVSNVRKGSPTLSNSDFKYAVGIDRKLAEGMWLELRAGRARSSDGTKLETKTLFGLKFSPETTLAKDSKD